MRRPLAVLLTSFAVFSSSSLARQDKPQSPESVAPAATDSLAITLLRESHDLDPQLPLRVRVSSLGAQAQMASRLTADLGREWANELFTLSFQTEGRERSYAQDTAAMILARVDPDRALELLHSMSTDEPEPNRTDWLPHRQLVDQVFQILVGRDGVRALPALEQEAERLGIAWHYPYAALAQAAMQTVSKEWGNNNQHAVEVVQSVFEKESQNYSQDPRREYFDDVEFGKMLRIVSGGLPPESTQPALRALVKNLIATDLKKYRFQSELYTKDGEVASADNAIDAAILNLGDVINRVDPELAKELQTTRPELRVGLDYARDERPVCGRLARVQRISDLPIRMQKHAWT